MSHADKLFIWGVAAITVSCLSPRLVQGIFFLVIGIVFFLL